MKAFDFVLLFFSFVYALALTHLLVAIARMIRHRRSVIFSLPHALWMIAALNFVIGNWVSLWDFHKMTKVTAAVIAAEFAFSILVYLVCALVSPDFNDREVNDLRAFHDRQGATYMTAALVTVAVAIPLNFAAGGIGIQNWANENVLVVAMLAPAIVPLVWRTYWIQVVSPLIMVSLNIAYMLLYYPVLSQ